MRGVSGLLTASAGITIRNRSAHRKPAPRDACQPLCRATTSISEQKRSLKQRSSGRQYLTLLPPTREVNDTGCYRHAVVRHFLRLNPFSGDHLRPHRCALAYQ